MAKAKSACEMVISILRDYAESRLDAEQRRTMQWKSSRSAAFILSASA